MKNTIKSLGLAGLVAMVGCSKSGLRNNDPEINIEQKDLTSILGTPLGIGESYSKDVGSFSVVIDIDGKKVIAYNKDSNFVTGKTRKYAMAQALVQSEINDGDADKIELIGKYESDGSFYINSLRANNNRIDF